jgi:hypothetical protein
MPQHLRSRLIFHGAVVFLLGMFAGFPYAFVLLAELNEGITTSIPGTLRAWRMAHLEGALNGMLLIIVSNATRHLTIGSRGQKVIVYGLVMTAWGNIVASINSALTGGRGLEFDGASATSVTYVLFMAAVVAVILSFMVIAEAAWRDSRTPGADSGSNS